MKKGLGIGLILSAIAILPIGIVGTVHVEKYKDVVCVNGIKYRHVISYGNEYYEAYDVCRYDQNLITSTYQMCDYIDNIPVTRIASNAFKNVDNFDYIKFPSTLELIENNAFVNCKNLYHVTFYGEVTIYDSAFSGCNNFFMIDDYCFSMTVYKGAFVDCDNIYSFNVDSTNVVKYLIGTTLKDSSITLKTGEFAENWQKVSTALNSNNLYIY